MVPTNEALPPPCLATDRRLKFTSLLRNVGQKWSGCMLTAARTQFQLEHYLQQASNFLYANRWILLDRTVSISKRYKYFNAVASPGTCFRRGHKAIYNSQLAILDVQFRNYADQSLERRQMLTGMRFGTKCCICGMNGSKTLLQMHTPTVELS